MTQKPTIFLKNDWGRLGEDGYPVVGFDERGWDTAQEVIETSKQGECWICIRATTQSNVERDMRECFICLVKFEHADEPLQTLDHISARAAVAEHRLDKKNNCKFKWPFCFKIKEICHTKKPYKKVTDLVPRIKGNYDDLTGQFLKLDDKECEDILNYFFEKRNFKWEKLDSAFSLCAFFYRMQKFLTCYCCKNS